MRTWAPLLAAVLGVGTAAALTPVSPVAPPAADGIDPDKLTDKEVVEQVSRWLFKRSKHRNMFCTFYVDFPGGEPRVLPGTEPAFDRDKGDKAWAAGEQFAHELFGQQMFARK